MARLEKTLTINYDLSSSSTFIDINKELDDLLTDSLGAVNYKLGKYKELNIQLNFSGPIAGSTTDSVAVQRSSIYNASGTAYGAVPDGTATLINSQASQDFNIGAAFNVSNYYGILFTKAAISTGTLTTITIVLNT